MYEGLPPFDLVYRFLVDRNFGLVALYNYHYWGGRTGQRAGATASSRICCRS
jgi:hypothetical protein